METKEYIVLSPEDFSSVIETILTISHDTQSATVVTLSGDLGAGKTTFTQELAKHLNITEPVVSPTFVVMKSYSIPDHNKYDQLVHIDAYRFEDESEAGPLRLGQVFNQPKTLVCLEWPERIENILPDERIDICIEIKQNDERLVIVKS